MGRGSSAHRIKRGEGGFTLMELMVVMTIIAIVTGAVVLTINWDAKERRLESFAGKLAAQIREVGEQAVIKGALYGLEFNTQNYRFMRYRRRGDSWRIEEVSSVSIPPDITIIFESDVQLRNKRESGIPLKVLFKDTGEWTPFALHLTAEGATPWRLEVRGWDDFVLESVKP